MMKRKGDWEEAACTVSMEKAILEDGAVRQTCSPLRFIVVIQVFLKAATTCEMILCTPCSLF